MPFGLKNTCTFSLGICLRTRYYGLPCIQLEAHCVTLYGGETEMSTPPFLARKLR